MPEKTIAQQAAAAAFDGTELFEIEQLGATKKATAAQVVALHAATPHGSLTAHASVHAAAGSDPVTVTKAQVTGLVTDLAAKAPLISPALTGTPTAPTAVQGTNTTAVATTAYVQTEAGLLIPKSLVDAAGDLLVGTADNVVGRLAKGAALNTLRVNAAATALEWAAVGGVIETVNTVAASGSAQTIPSPSVASISRITLTANCILTFPTATAGMSFTLVLVQDSPTGSRTVTWPAAAKWPSAVPPVLSTGAGKIDYLSFLCTDGSTWAGFVAGFDVR